MSSLRLLFCWDATPTRQCCCGCTLKLGVQILTILSIIGSVLNIVTQAKYSTTLAVYIALGIISLISSCLLLASTCNYNKSYAKFGFYVNEIYFIISIFSIIFIGIWMANSTFEYNGRTYYFSSSMIIMFYVIAIPSLLLSFYFLYVIYSYARYLDEDNISVVDSGADMQGNQNSNYMPPQNQEQTYPNQVNQA